MTATVRKRANTEIEMVRTPRWAFSTRLRTRTALRKSLPTSLSVCFLLFLFSMPLEDWMASIAIPTKIFGLLFFGFCFLSPNRCFSRPPDAAYWFLGYIAVYMFNGFLRTEADPGKLISTTLTMIQLIVLLWVGSNVLKEEQLAKSALLAYSMATVLLALGVVLELPGFSSAFETRELQGGMRMTATGSNPNELSAMAALAAVMLIGLGLDKSMRSPWRKALLAGLTLPLLVLMVRTGSRTGIAAFASGVCLYLLPLVQSSNKRRTTSLIAAAAALIALGYMVVTDPLSSARWSVAFHEGDGAGRENIYSGGIDMFLERPLLGWGPQDSSYELSRRSGQLWDDRDPHSLLLRLVLDVGAVGSAQFLIGLWLCVRAAWTNRMGNMGLLPCALLITVLVINLFNTWLNRKPMWFIFALALAAAQPVGLRKISKRFTRRIGTASLRKDSPRYGKQGLRS
jgi:O-antigen ligase